MTNTNKEMKDSIPRYDFYVKTSNNWDDAGSPAIELSETGDFVKYEDHVKAIAALSAPASEQQWISVKDQLPEADTKNCSIDCLIFFGTEDEPNIEVGYFYLNELKGDKVGEAFVYSSRRNVDASSWIPLPVAPAQSNPAGSRP